MDFDDTLRMMIGPLMAVTIAVAILSHPGRPAPTHAPRITPEAAALWQHAWNEAAPMLQSGN